MAVGVIVAAAGAEEPSVEAGTVVFLHPLVSFLSSIVAGIRGRPLGWATRFAVVAAITLALTWLTIAVVRFEFGAVYLGPLIALVAGAVLWLCCGAGWLLGGVIRYGLGLGDALDEDDDVV